jgi:hypothetical protein
MINNKTADSIEFQLNISQLHDKMLLLIKLLIYFIKVKFFTCDELQNHNITITI